MVSRAVNYKLERTAEAVEDFALAIVADHPRTAISANLSNARQELRDALAEFLAPMLRVVSNEPKHREH